MERVIVYGLVKMSVTLIAFSWMVDRYGRRKLLIGGGTALCTCMLSVAICVSTLPIQTTSSASSDVSPASYAVSHLFLSFAFFMC